MRLRLDSCARTALGILGLSLVLITLRLLSPLPRTVDIGGGGDAYSAFNFYAPEVVGGTSFRWSGPNSAFAAPEPSVERLLLRLRMHGIRDGQRFVVGAGTSMALTTNWRVYHFIAAAPAPSHQIALQVELVRPGTADPRDLGAALDWVRFLPLGGERERLGSALGEAVLLVWALALVGVALMVIQPGWPAIAGLGIVSLTVGFWAWLDPAGLSWLLPLTPGALALISFALLGVWLFAWAEPRLRQLIHLARIPWPLTVLVLAHVVLWAPLSEAWRGAAALVILWTPGWLAAGLLLRHERERAMQVVLGITGALVLQVCLGLLATGLRGLNYGIWLLLLSNSLSIVLLVARLRLPRPDTPLQKPPRLAVHPRSRLLPTLLVLLLATAVRLPALGAAELHDDEASVLLAAADVAYGRPEVLLLQLKGPAQILLPAGPLALSGQLNEQTARLPFAVASLAVVLGGMALARRLTGSQAAALTVGFVLALDGLLIAFARIVQYQSLVLLSSLAACWCCWRFAQGAPGARRYLLMAALCMAVALLAHYDTIYTFPTLLLLVALGVRRRAWNLRAAGSALAGPLVLAAGLLAAFYVPFVLHPHFQKTLNHLQERSGQGQRGLALYNNLPVSYDLLSVYNTRAQLLATTVLAIIGAAWGVVLLYRRVRGQKRRASRADRSKAQPFRHLPPTVPGSAALTWAAVLWLGSGWLSMGFLVAQPRTHIYVAAIPAALLAGAGARQILRLGPRLSRFSATGGLLLVLGTSFHQEVVFLRQSPEYVRSYPAAQIAPLPGGSATLGLDPAARFGFPARDGWKAIAELYRRGELSGALATNQSAEVVAWYLRGQEHCGSDPGVYLVAISAPNPLIPMNFVRTGAVQVDGRDQLLIYQNKLGVAPMGIVPLERYVAAFDEERLPPMPPSEGTCATSG